MKTLFSEQPGFRMNEDARALDREFSKVVRPIFKKYLDMGYSPREISHILYGIALDEELDAVLSPPKKDT